MTKPKPPSRNGLAPGESNQASPTKREAPPLRQPITLAGDPAIENQAGTFPRTDDELGERFAQEFGDNLKFVPVWNQWVSWNGTRWEVGETKSDALAQRKATELLAKLHREIEGLSDKELLRQWKHASSIRGKCGMIQLAKSRLSILATPDQFDQDPWLFGVENGTVDLRTGKFRPGKREDFITKVAGCRYDADAQCPWWDWFITWAFQGDSELVHYVDKMLGYSLTGIVTEQKLNFAYGVGENGKTTFMETLLALWGDYGRKVASRIFTKNGFGDIKETLIAGLLGARLVIGAEFSGARIDEAMVKDLTGSDTLQGRWLYGRHFSFKPTHKIWGYGNDRPSINGRDHGIWRRMALVPFEAKVVEKDKDPKLPKHIHGELSGILNRMICACLAWQAEGLGDCKAVRVATEDYKDDEDVLVDFIKEHCEFGEGLYVTREDLYKHYEAWFLLQNQSDRYKLGTRAFCPLIRHRKGVSENKSHGERWWLGIGLK
jgi:putative DNA primase/helicase